MKACRGANAQEDGRCCVGREMCRAVGGRGRGRLYDVRGECICLFESERDKERDAETRRKIKKSEERGKVSKRRIVEMEIVHMMLLRGEGK